MEGKYGKNNVWNVHELQKDFHVLGFLAPYIACERKSDKVIGSMEFQHHPRFYFNFQRADGKFDSPRTIGEVLGLKTKEDIDNWVIEWARRVFPKDIAEKQIELFLKENEENKNK